jgi:hypothetical protein
MLSAASHARKKADQKLIRLKAPADAQGECGEDQVAGCSINVEPSDSFHSHPELHSPASASINKALLARTSHASHPGPPEHLE